MELLSDIANKMQIIDRPYNAHQIVLAQEDV